MNQILGNTEEIKINNDKTKKKNLNINKNDKNNNKKKNILKKVLITFSILIILGISSLRYFIIWTI